MNFVTDLYPSISFAYGGPEGDVMENLPRNPRLDRLVNRKLISFAYLQIGVIKVAAGLFTYFYIMNDYGFTPTSLFGLTGIESYRPLDTDVYSPSEPYKGNSCVDRENVLPGCEDHVLETFDFLTTKMSAIDVRLFFWERPVDNWSKCRWGMNDAVPEFWKYSDFSQSQICYTAEALYYAQCGYFVSMLAV